jgi:ssDNA-binding Zn-finger/Zn-ribbon topoisomerase 1
LPSVIVGKRCHHCQRFFSDAGLQFHAGGAQICHECEESFVKSLAGLGEFVAGNVGCPLCRVSKEALQIRHGSADIPMYLHRMDGTTIPLCEDCHEKIVPKMARQYRGTKFGEDHKL